MKILVLTLRKAMGELIVYSPVFRLLRKAYPEAEIDLMMDQAYAGNCLAQVSAAEVFQAIEQLLPGNHLKIADQVQNDQFTAHP